MVGKGSDLGGLEFARGRFGSFPIILLLTSMLVCMFASVLFLLFAMMGLSGKTS